MRQFPVPRVSVQCGNGYWHIVPQPFPTCLAAAAASCCCSWCLPSLSPAKPLVRTWCHQRPPTPLLPPPPRPLPPSPLLPVRGGMCGATITSKEMSAGESYSLLPSTFSRLRRTGRSAVPRRRTARTVSNKCALPSFQLSTPPPHKGGKICSRCGQLNIYVPNPCKMIKWNTLTLNHSPPHTLCCRTPSPWRGSLHTPHSLPPHLPHLSSLSFPDRAGRCRVVAVPRRPLSLSIALPHLISRSPFSPFCKWLK